MSKKVKGTKVDLGTFLAEPSQPMPSGPASSGYSGGASYGGRYQSLDNEEGGGYRGGGMRHGGGYDGERPPLPPSEADEDNNWRKGGAGGPSGGRSGGFSGGDRFGGDRYGGRDEFGSRGGGYSRGREDYGGGMDSERPRLNLVPRSSSLPAPLPTQSSEDAPKPSEDKWSSAFARSTSLQDASSRGSNGFGGGYQGGMETRRQGWGDSSGSSGYGGRPSGSGGTGGSRFGGGSESAGFGGARSSGGFGGGYGDRGGGFGNRSGYGRDPRQAPIPLPTAPRAALQESQPQKPKVPKGPSAAELKAIEDEKNAKAEKKAKREAMEAAAKEAKAKREEEAAMEAEKAKASALVAQEAAKTALKTGLKGPALLDHVKQATDKPSGAMMLKEILDNNTSDLMGSKFWTVGEYFEVLSSLLSDSEKNQESALFAVQAFCAEQKFPTVEVKGATKKLIVAIFTVLLSSQLIDGESFIRWAESEDEETVGRLDAIVQTTMFVQTVRELLEEEEDEDEDAEEEDDEEIDRPRETC